MGHGGGANVWRSAGRSARPRRGPSRTHHDAALGQELVDVAQAQREAQVRPDRVLDDGLCLSTEAGSHEDRTKSLNYALRRLRGEVPIATPGERLLAYKIQWLS